MSLSRLRLTPGSHEVLDASKRGHDQLEPTESERIDAMEFVARVLVQIPDPRRHLVRYGAYSNVARAKRRKAEAPPQPSVSSEASMAEPTPGRTARPSGGAGRILFGASTKSTPSCVLASEAK